MASEAEKEMNHGAHMRIGENHNQTGFGNLFSLCPLCSLW